MHLRIEISDHFTKIFLSETDFFFFFKLWGQGAKEYNDS